ncbi:GNAT family N-acetyltransferase [Mesonia ostreae]|uniref:GNAT family N-acetyltransferase n=1 Tax=Mesonia ostreae TaxID=861110 RepID=A0ABU2KIF7_9FLAO|nr:GNAT family N-acetyltransferase [Mesonia ostreae]MDT0294464.1 GNAT family N-acetyltransferase [Mesonia ostreae]
MEDFMPLSTSRLQLRSLQTHDWEEISYLRSDRQMNQYVSRSSAKNKKEALNFIYKIQKGIQNKEILYWSICLKDESKMIGSICLWNFSEDRLTAEVGYDLAMNSQGKGIMDEALNKLIHYAFSELDLQKIKAFTHKDNAKSLALLERNHFQINTQEKDEGNVYNVVLELLKSICVSD